MNIFVNNQPTTTAACTLQELAEELQLPAAGVAIAIDNRMIPRATWNATPLTEDARIIIIKAACGG